MEKTGEVGLENVQEPRKSGPWWPWVLVGSQVLPQDWVPLLGETA